MTALIFSFLKPTESAASMPSNTVSRLPLPPDIFLNCSGSIESRLTVIRFNPHALSSSEYFFSKTPFVVRAMSSIFFSVDRSPMSSVKLTLNKGSPPVILILLTPKSVKSLVILKISSNDNLSLDLRKLKPE